MGEGNVDAVSLETAGESLEEQLLKQWFFSETLDIELYDILAMNEVVNDLRRELREVVSECREIQVQDFEPAIDFVAYYQLSVKHKHIRYLWLVYRELIVVSRKLMDVYILQLLLGGDGAGQD